MLHSTLPRAFLTPGLKYLGSYYGDEVPGYQTTSYPSQFEEHYPRLTEHHVFPTWHTIQRSTSPCPLDLSLKPGRSEDDEIRGYVLEPEVLERKKEDDVERLPSEEKSDVSDLPTGRSYHPEKIPLSPHRQSGVQGYQQLLMTPQHHLQGIHAPMTPPSTPSPPQCPRKRHRDEVSGSSSNSPPGVNLRQSEKTPRTKKKHARRLKFDEDTSSPVSGTVILGPDEAVVTGDIDPAFNVVEVTEEARAELAKIENRLGPYQCRLCRQLHEDAFQLAQHRCSRIAHVEYRCPECDKRFSCPANLASHRRWHKPRVSNTEENGQGTGTGGQPIGNEFACSRCDAKFGRQAALRKHVGSQHCDVIGTGNDGNEGNTVGSNTGGVGIVGNIGETPSHVVNQLGVSTINVEMP